MSTTEQTQGVRGEGVDRKGVVITDRGVETWLEGEEAFEGGSEVCRLWGPWGCRLEGTSYKEV